MRVTSAIFRDFKRFKDLRLEAIPPDTRLVVLAGPNGTGKSTVFDGFRSWQGIRVGGYNQDLVYYNRPNYTVGDVPGSRVILGFDREPEGPDEIRRAFYIRSAYRHEADFTVSAIQRMQSPLEQNRFTRMIDLDTAVSIDYQHLVGATFDGMFDPATRERKVGEVVDALIGEVQAAMERIFPDLKLEGLQNPMSGDGSFYFTKGTSHHWHYKNLSGGERAAFDLLLDMVVRRSTFHDTVYCIDEPETHLNTKVQAALLCELVQQLPPNCQLWIASHSIGMMREALRLHHAKHGVVFLDFDNRNFDEPAVILPSVPDRHFWQSVLHVALDDLGELVAPRVVVVVEGRPQLPGRGGNAEFDARCLRVIFGQTRPDVQFISGGGSDQVEHDKLALAQSISVIVPGTTVIKLLDRDDRSEQEIKELALSGTRTLLQRDIESYLMADEIISKLAECAGQADKADALLDEKYRLLKENATKARPDDDVKTIAGSLKEVLRKQLGLTQTGNKPQAFMRDTMAPLITPDTETYRELDRAIFG